MARQKGLETHITVSKGFATEVNPVAASPEVLVDIDNCIIARDATIRRRLGVDFEAGFRTNLINSATVGLGELNTLAFSTGLWTAVNNIGTLNIVVQQVGNVLQFYSQFGTLSANFIGETDLTVFSVNSPSMRVTPMGITSGLGKLFVVNPYMEPVAITFENGSFTVEAIIIQLRDFTGLDDGLAVDVRPNRLTLLHYYNLRNQGWIDVNISKFAGLASGTNLCSGSSSGNGLSAASGELWPSNSDIMSVGIVVNSSADLEFDATFIKESALGNTPAPKGHFILNAFHKDFNSALECSGIPSEINLKRPEAIAFHQGRIFYSAPSDNEAGNGVYFSQQLLEDASRGQCFQSADPTADEINDLVATDGGYLPTPGAGQVYKMQEMANGIVSFNSNGVWYITGADVGSAVQATSLRLDKIHSSGVLSATSVVEAEGAVYFFGEEGIMRVTVTLEGAKVENISKSSIQSFYVDINTLSRKKAVSEFIPTERKIFWGYSSSSVEGSTLDKFLILDLDVGGYYKYTIVYDDAQTYPQVVGMSRVAPLAQNLANQTVLETDGSIVTESDGTTLVTVDGVVETSQISELKLATMTEDGTAGQFSMTFSTFDNLSLRDWATSTVGLVGLPMVSFIDFAQTAMGAIHTKGKPTWVNSFYSKASKNVGRAVAVVQTNALLGCVTDTDVVLLLDISDSMLNASELATDIIPGVKGLITAILNSSTMTGARIAIDGFASSTGGSNPAAIHFEDFTDVEATLHTAVDTAYGTNPLAGFTNLGDGVILAGETLADELSFLRAQVIFMVTDGVGNRPADVALTHGFVEAELLRDIAEIYVAGVGGVDGFNDFYLQNWIATTPDYYFQLAAFVNFDELVNIVDCPATQGNGVDYLGAQVEDTFWRWAQGELEGNSTRVEWIESFGLYVKTSTSPSPGFNDVFSNITTSPDGLVWTERDPTVYTATGFFVGFHDITYSSALGLAVVVGEEFGSFDIVSGFRTSTDGITWTKRTTPDGSWFSVTWVPEKSLFVATGTAGIATSSDGVIWTMRSTAASIRSMAYSASLGLFVALQRFSPNVYTSTDGITWAVTTSVLGNGDWHDIEWSDDAAIFVAVSDKNFVGETVAQSTDGTTWTKSTFTSSTQEGRQSVKWFQGLGKFVSISERNPRHIISSADGITWTIESLKSSWNSSLELIDIANKSTTEWVIISSSSIANFYSNAAPF